MKKLCTLLIAILALGAFGARAAGEPAQQTCPYTGKPINTKISAVHEGQRVYFCCGACKKQFEADPQAALAKLKEAGVKLEPVQTTCPVMGGPINKNIHVEYQGRTVYLCCQACVGKFNRNPEKYADKLPWNQGDKEKAEK